MMVQKLLTKAANTGMMHSHEESPLSLQALFSASSANCPIRKVQFNRCPSKLPRTLTRSNSFSSGQFSYLNYTMSNDMIISIKRRELTGSNTRPKNWHARTAKFQLGRMVSGLIFELDTYRIRSRYTNHYTTRLNFVGRFCERGTVLMAQFIYLRH